MRLSCKTYLLAFAAFLMVANANVHAQSAFYTAANNYLKKRADAFMTITGYSLTPDVTTLYLYAIMAAITLTCR
jgi:hypothetical protein